MRLATIVLIALPFFVQSQDLGKALAEQIVSDYIAKGKRISKKIEIPYTNILPNADKNFLGTYDKEAANFIFMAKSKKEGWVRVTWDPVRRQVIDKTVLKDVYKKFTYQDAIGFASISPNSEYLVVDRSFKTGIVFHNLKENTAIIEKGKMAFGGSKGVAFIDNDYFYQIFEQATGHLLVKRMVDGLYSAEQFQLGDLSVKYTNSKGNSFSSTQVLGLGYSPISAYGHPILVMTNYNTVFVFNEETKQLVNRFDWGIPRGSFQISPMGRYLIASKMTSGTRWSTQGYYQVFDLQTGEMVFSQQAPDWRALSFVLSEVTEEMYTFDSESNVVRIHSVPKVIQEELDYQNWLRKCEAKRDSIATVADTLSPEFKINSPNGDWIYTSGDGSNGMANGIGNAIRKDGLRFIKNGLFIDGNFVAGKMENVYEVTMEGEFKDMKLNGFGRHVTETKAIFEGTFVDGKLEGQGEMIEPSGLTYVGGFTDGLYDGKGLITASDGDTYEGEFQKGQPHGEGIQVTNGRPEEVKYYQGERIDQAYLMRIEREKMEQERIRQQQQFQKQQQLAAQRAKKKKNSNLLGGLLMGAGAGLAGSSVGMDAMQAMEFGTSMMQDVMNGGMSNLNQFQNKMMSEFAQQRADSQVEQSQAYQQKAQEKNCNLSEIYEGPDGGQGGAFCAQATLMKCHGKFDRVAQLCKMYKQVTAEPCPVCN